MFNGLRSKLVALAALAASFVRPGDHSSRGPEITHHADPAFREPQIRRPRKGRRILRLFKSGPGARSENPAGTKLFKRFAEAGARGPRGY